MRLRFAHVLVVCALRLASPLFAESGFDRLTAHVQELARRGETAELEAMVAAVEAQPLPDTAGSREMVQSLCDGLTRGGQPELAARVGALSPVSPVPLARPATPFRFPRDHGSHATALLEWWYFNGHLRVAGKRYGYMVTFFRTLPRVAFAHLAITDIDAGTHAFERHFLRPSAVRASSERMDVTFGGDQVQEVSPGVHRLQFTVAGQRWSLDLSPERAPMIINGDGVIDMPEGTTSRYYSQTRLATTGTVTDRTGVKPITGQSWLDHQWGNFIALARPWDWFCFQLDDGTDYNIFHFRDALGFAGRTCVNKLDARGRLSVSTDMSLTRDAWWKSPRTGNHFVTGWSMRLTGLAESAAVSTPVADQEMPRASWYDFPPAYWEGAVDVLVRRADGTAVHGTGYCEHFPYRAPER